MKSDRPSPVAIIGGGFSGTILAAQLARRGIASVLIDGSGRMGRGVAYSTTEPAHLLNVRAEGMSAWAGEPDHFADALRSAKAATGAASPSGGCSAAISAKSSTRRLPAAVRKLSTAAAVRATERERRLAGRARRRRRRSRPTRWCLQSATRSPKPLSAFAGAGERFIRNPWGAEARSAVERSRCRAAEAALLVGTGLTMVDLVLSLDAAGHRGKIVGLVAARPDPARHADFEPAPVEPSELPDGDLRALWRWLRRRGAEVGWRAAVDSLRPHSQALWQGLDGEQQRRFLRHARPWWDVHRHRIAPEVARTLARLIARGPARDRRRPDHLGARRRATRSRSTSAAAARASRRRSTFAYAFNCTGPLHSIARTRDPLLRSLLDAGQIRARSSRHRARGRRALARRANGSWALGPLTKGRYWEIIAVPDIREQAAAVADDIAAGAWRMSPHSSMASRRTATSSKPRRRAKFPSDVSEAVRTLIRWAGDDPDREGLLDTPRRVARAWQEYARGYEEDPAVHLSRTFEEVGGYDEIVLLKDIPFQSHCEHHMAPIIGKAAIAYLPQRQGGRDQQARARAPRLRAAAPGAGAADRAGRRRDLGASPAQGRGGGDRGEPRLHDRARRQHARRDDDHQPDDGHVPRGRAQPPRGARADGLLSERQAGRLRWPESRPAPHPDRRGAQCA